MNRKSKLPLTLVSVLLLVMVGFFFLFFVCACGSSLQCNHGNHKIHKVGTDYNLFYSYLSSLKFFISCEQAYQLVKMVGARVWYQVSSIKCQVQR